MNHVHALEQARERVRYGWCQGTAARDVNGKAVFSDDEDAVQWCAGGSVKQEPLCLKYLATAIHNQGWCDDRPEWHVVADWNDAEGRTKEEVVELFTQAIALAREEQK